MFTMSRFFDFVFLQAFGLQGLYGRNFSFRWFELFGRN